MRELTDSLAHTHKKINTLLRIMGFTWCFQYSKIQGTIQNQTDNEPNIGS